MLEPFFTSNYVIVLFIYGQVFFSMGLVIALQSWRHSRLALARTLKWLATFGILHGLHEWADVFIPLQARYLAPPAIDLLIFLQLILLAVSFACLFQFGVEMVRPLPGRWIVVRLLPALLFVLWLGFASGPLLQLSVSSEEWLHQMSIGARYFIGLPGALVAAYGMVFQARLLGDLRQPRDTGAMLLLAAGALVAYGVLGGLIVVQAPFFPASIINQEWVLRMTGIPVQVFRSLSGLVLAFAIFRVLEVFQIELDRHILAMEEMQMLLADRERIGRELHDGTLQSIYAAGMLLSAAERDFKQDNSARALDYVQQSVHLMNQSVTDIRSYIGELRPQPTERSLRNGLQELADSRHLRSLVDLELDLPVDSEIALSPSHIRHLLAIANEALSNVARHAQASQVHIRVSSDSVGICLEIADNGHGLPADHVQGYGLRNMQERTRLLDGTFALASEPGEGTTLQVRVPWKEMEPGVATSAR